MNADIEARLRAALHDTADRNVSDRTAVPQLVSDGTRPNDPILLGSRIRRWAAPLAAASVVAAVVGVGLGLSDHTDRRTAITKPGPLTCPAAFTGRSPWVPNQPQGIDGRSRMAPTEVPTRALVCAYRVGRASLQPALTGSRPLIAGLADLAADLTWLPPLIGGESPGACPGIGIGEQTDYLLGLTYPNGTEWVATTDDISDCTGTSNGPFSSPTNIGAQIAASYLRGAWQPPPKPHITGAEIDPCLPTRSGRLGQETQLIPGTPESLRICQLTMGVAKTTYRQLAVNRNFEALVAAVNNLPTTPSVRGCQGDGMQNVAYEILANYPQGPPVNVRIDPHCTPSIDNGTLQATNPSTVIPLIQRLLAGAH
jgi:hypothetical protein